MIEFLGWTVDMQPCAAHGGVGVGMNLYFTIDNTQIIHLWWCSVDPLSDFLEGRQTHLSCT